MSASASSSTTAHTGLPHHEKGSTTNAGVSDLTTAAQQSRFQPRRFLTSNIDQGQTLLQLTVYCFLTGFTSAPTFLACYLWCGFQTGGLVQLSLAVARLFASSPRDTRFHKPDQQALTSLLAFLLGTSLGRIGDKVGCRRRWWIMTATFIMALFTMAAALCAHYSEGPSVAQYRLEAGWQDALGMAALAFASASLGLQGIVAKRINSQFGTSVVLTTVWVELVCSPSLLAFKLNKFRDHRVIAVFAVFCGGLCSAAIVFVTSSAVAFGVCSVSGRRLYIGRVPPDAVKRDLEDHFAGHGRLVDIRLMNGFAFVEYDRLSDAEQAVQDLGSKDFMGERLLVEFAKPPRERDARDDRRGPPPPRYGDRGDRDYDRGGDRGFDRGGDRGGDRGFDRGGYDRPPPSRPVARGGTGYRLVVSNLREGTSWQDLKDFARQVGNCAFSDVDRRDPTVGYIEYALRGDADEAVRKLTGTELNGVTVTVAEDANAPAPRAASSRYDDRPADRGYGRRDDDYPPRRSYDDRRDEKRRTRSPSPDRRGDREKSEPRKRTRSPSPRRSRSPERERD